MRTPTAVSAGRLARCLSLRSLAGLGRLVALLLGEAAPDVLDLPGPQRERETRGRTGQRADRPRLGRLLQRPARGRAREEQIGIGGPAGGKLPPLTVGNQPRHLGAVRGQPGGCLVTAPRARLRPARTTASSKRACMAALRAALHKHVGESIRQTRTVCPGAVTGTRRSAIQGDGKGWPEPAHARLSAEDRSCGAAVARITMIW